MSQASGVPLPSSLSFTERYVAFLLAELPRLKTVALHASSHSVPLSKREVLLTALDMIPDEGEGICLEFGVYKGKSLRIMAERKKRRKFFGFDSFKGFPEEERQDWQKDFAVEHLPKVPDNCELIQGWFDKTLETFLDNHPEPVDFIDIDCDIYSSTRYVLQTLLERGRLRPGLVIYFDELVNYATHPWHELLALFELLEAGGFGLRWVALHQNLLLLDDVVHLHESGRFPSWRSLMKRGYEAPAALQLTKDGIDYGPLHLPHYMAKVKDLAQRFEKLTARFENGEIQHDTTKPVHERLRLFIKHKVLKRGLY